jgi:hypothetical protein
MFNLPLKTKENSKGIFSEQELYTVLALIFAAIFFDIDPAKSFPLRQAARTVAQQLGGIIETNVKVVTGWGLKGLFTSSPSPQDDFLAAYGNNLIKGLKKSGLSTQDIAWSQILPTAGAMVPNQAEVFAQAVDFYLGEGKDYLDEIQRVARLPDGEESDALLLGYAMEGVRLAGTFGTYRAATVAETVREDDGTEVQVRPGNRVFVSFVSSPSKPPYIPLLPHGH